MIPAVVALIACSPSPPPLLVLAPSSTQVPVERLVRDWATSRRTEATVVFDDSAALARMVDGGTPADLLLLSDPVRMDGLEDRQHIDRPTRTALVGDDLAVVASIVAARAPRDLPGLTAQAGAIWLPPDDSAEAAAAERLLTEAGAWEHMRARVQHAHDEDDLMEAIQADPQAVGLVSAGRGNLGVNVAARFTLDAPRPPLLIETAVVAHAARPETAAALIGFLLSPEAEAPFRARGFRGVQDPGPASGPAPSSPPHPPRPSGPRPAHDAAGSGARDHPVGPPPPPGPPHPTGPGTPPLPRTQPQHQPQPAEK